MDGFNGYPEKLKNFKKEDFETDWFKVSEGRFSQVYRVKLKVWRQQCALKSLDTGQSASNSYSGTMKEASSIAEVKFKYIVSIYGFCCEPVSILMEFMDSGSLDNLLPNILLMWPKKFQMIHEIALGMNYLHTMRLPMLHLNLKTSNILLDEHLHAKISDFGLVKWEEDSNKRALLQHLIARGNTSYIPPEMFIHCPDPPGTAFDVYSFAIVMWEILTQQKPYQGTCVTSLLVEVSGGKRPPLGILPDHRPPECQQMVDIMQYCWDQEARRRPPFSDIVRNTEALSDVMKMPGAVVNLSYREDSRASDCTWLFSKSQVDVPVFSDLPSDKKHGKEGLLYLLSKKDFASFRQSVKQEHTRILFSENNNLLHYTTASGDTETVRHVLALGAEVNSCSSRGYTPLIIAVQQRLHEMVALLLENGAAANQADEDQWTPLHFAAQNGDAKVVQLLLNKGAEAECREKADWTPLHLACQNDYEAVVRLLLSRVSDAALGTQEGKGRTALHLACAYKCTNIVKLLLSKGADANAMDRSLCTPLHLSAEEGHNVVVRHLLKAGADVKSVNSQGYTPLHLAALRGHKGICDLLLSNSAEPDPRTHQDWTPMHLAAVKGHQATVLRLESQGGCVNARGQNGWTPLHLACHHDHQDTVAKLLAAKADPNAVEDSAAWTPLHIACQNNSFPNVLQLILHHADVTAVTNSQATPLHLAAQRGCVPIVKALLLNGADRTARDATGSIPLALAQRRNNTEVAELLAQGQPL